MRTTFCSLTRCITTKCLTLLALALLAMAIMAPLASAQNTPNCLQDEYNKVNSQKLQCTANDVRVAKVINIRDLQGNPLTQCVAGGPNINFIADYLVETTSTSSRSNIGLYFDTGNVNVQTDALSGSCSDNIIPPVTNPPGFACGSDTTVKCGTTKADEFEGDTCGDTSSTDPNVCLDPTGTTIQMCTPTQTANCSVMTESTNQCYPSTQVVTVEIHNFPCIAPTGTNQLVLPNCTSWQTPGKTITCNTNGPFFPYPFNGPNGTPTAIPGSPSKCNCETIPLGIIVQTPALAAGKACNTAITTGTPSFTFTSSTGSGTPDHCDSGIEGTTGTVTYTVAIKNTTADTGGITINQICDTYYGTVYRLSSLPNTFAACPAGTGTITSGTNGCLTTNWDIAKGATQTCTFHASVNNTENAQVQDIISATGTGDISGGAASATSNQVTVFAEEAPSTATASKSFNATAAACATVRYKVDVANTSGADEDLSLTALNDTSFGQITPTTASDVVGTTCGVTAGSLGTGSLGGFTVDAPGTAPSTNHLLGGALPDSLLHGGNDYVCYFDAMFCSTDTGGVLGSVVITHGVCSNPGPSGACTTGGPTPAGGCTSNAQCDVTCTGIQNSDSITATISSGETGESLTGVCTIPTGQTTGTCTAGLVGASCTSASQCNALTVTPNTLTVTECVTPH